MRTIPEVHKHMLKVDEKIENILLPSLLGEEVTKKKNFCILFLLELGIAVSNFSEKCKHDDAASKKFSKLLTNLITQQSKKLPSLTETLELWGEVQKKTH